MPEPSKVANMSRAEFLIKRYRQVKGLRQNFESFWQSLHDYFYVESSDISTTYYPGSELNFNYLWDATTLEAADVLASGFMNYLTPPTSRWFTLKHANPILQRNKRVASYLESVSDEVNSAINRSNFYYEIHPSYKASGVYGTSVLMEEQDVEDDIRFLNVPIKNVCIIEDARGRVAEYYLEFEYTAFQAMTRFGEEKLSAELKRESEQRSDKKYPFLLYVARRYKLDVSKSNKENMPIEALWIDVTAKSTVSEDGYNEFPIFTHRFNKRSNIPWGFSPAMKALPMARILNAISKTNLRSMMKQTDPPVAVPDNAFIKPYNANPRATNYYKKGSLDPSKNIFPFGNYGNVEVGMRALEYYASQVKSLMYNDVFLAFDNITKQMNNPEVMERINEKMTLLGPAVGRYTGEVLDPGIIRTIGILERRGKLPEPPDEIMLDPGYIIDYVGQLAQAQKRSELSALMQALGATAEISKFDLSVLDKIDGDKTIDNIWGVTGAPMKILRPDNEVDAIRENKAQAAAKAQELAMLQGGADVVKKGSEVDKNIAQAGAMREKK